MKPKVVEEHVVLIEEPGSMFLTHVCQQSGRAQEVFNEIIQNLPALFLSCSCRLINFSIFRETDCEFMIGKSNFCYSFSHSCEITFILF